MSYPLISEYVDAILSPEDSFDELKNLQPVLDMSGKPIMSSGNFAVVFKMVDGDGKYYALKCFLRDQEKRADKYRLISERLKDVCSPYFVEVKYYEKELFVDSKQTDETEFPVLLMDWVEGLTALISASAFIRLNETRLASYENLELLIVSVLDNLYLLVFEERISGHPLPSPLSPCTHHRY